MKRINGWAGKRLDIDLTTMEISTTPLPTAWTRRYIGASGFGSRILYDEVGPEVEAFSPENRLIVAAGPLTGTLAPSGSRCELTTKSPLTGILGRSSTGGTFGSTMKLAGYDVIVVRGKAKKPAYIWIDDDVVEIRDASHLWGQDVWKTHHTLCDTHRANKITDGQFLNEIATLTIGPAGENLSMAACVMDGVAHAAGIGAIGAVWGYKNLKGIAARGSKGVNVANPEEFLQLTKALWTRSKRDPMWESTHKWGTMAWVGGSYSRSKVARVFVRGSRNEAIEEKGFDPLIEANRGCHGCAIGCDHFLNVREGKYKGAKGEGVEGFVQIYALSFKTMSAAFLAKYNNMCNQLGLNLSSVGSAVVWAMELWKAGLITEADTEGIEVTEGNEEAILQLVQKMAYREGFGDILADYPLRGAERLGRNSDLYAAHTKGQFAWVPSHGIGTTLIYTLGLNTATRGYDHLTGCLSILTKEFRAEPMFGITDALLTKLGQERYGDPKVFMEPWKFNPNTVRAEYDFENLLYICDMVGMCKFATQYNLPVHGLCEKDIADLLTAGTGEAFGAEDLNLAARRVFALERAYNAREGMRRIDDYPFFLRWKLEHGEPHPVYVEDQVKVNSENYGAVLDEWYTLRGYDLKTGIPTRPELEKLELKDVATDLEGRNILPRG